MVCDQLTNARSITIDQIISAATFVLLTLTTAGTALLVNFTILANLFDGMTLAIFVNIGSSARS